MKEFLLIITVMMPADQPDLQRSKPVSSIEACYAGAREWLAKPLDEDMKRHGVVGLAATCAWRDEDGEKGKEGGKKGDSF